MRVGQSGSDVELELRVVLDVISAKLDIEPLALLHESLVQHVVKGRVELLPDILKDDRVTLRDGNLELLQVVGVFLISHDELILAHLLDPFVGLVLRVDVQAPSQTLGHKDTVLSRKVVRWQAVALPLAGEGFSSQKFCEEVRPAERNFLFNHFLAPLLVQIIAVVAWERPSV